MSKRPFSEVGVGCETESPAVVPGPSRPPKIEPNGVVDPAEGIVPKEEDKKRVCLEKTEASLLHSTEVKAEGPMMVIEYREGDLAKQLLAVKSREEGPQNVEVVFLADLMTCSHQPVRARQLWGDLIYTHDSDIVAVLLHLGYYRMVPERPPSIVMEIRALIKLLPVQQYYASNTRHGLRSRSWRMDPSKDRKYCSYKVEGCWLVKDDNTSVELYPALEKESDFIPTFTPAAFDRAMNTRATTASAERRQRYVPELCFLFNLCNEPWLKYSMQAVADRGLKQWQWTSARLHSEVLYLETKRERFELAWTEGDSNQQQQQQPNQEKVDLYQWSKCKSPLPLAKMRQHGTPLSKDQVDVVHPNLKWNEVKWGMNSVQVRGEDHQVLRIHFMQRSHQKDSQSSS
ncbi:unnamed protein product [Ostreobium quekettii]|uniref:Uncharacterized protein n=1 Tax=Ostreobium quekettii TaxID=121088 RepID=A0A8S1IWN9_9CHLO|nr:unnamed protein product [Ostreobium quekettii]